MAEAAAKTTFDWEGKDAKGNKVQGQMEGPNVDWVKAQLRRKGTTPLKVRKKKASSFGQRGKKIQTADIAIFARQMATMMDAGIPLVQSFEIVGNGLENPRMQQLVFSLKGEVESGSNLSGALRKYPLYFDSLFCNLVAAGEQSGTLDDLLDKIATYKEKTEALKAKIKKAMYYPIAVIVVAIVVTMILLVYVVPQFENLFNNFGGELPAFTQFVVSISDFMQKWWWVVLGLMVGIPAAILQAKKRSQGVADAFDKLALKIPITGDILWKAAIARFARTLSTMSAAGVPLVEAMESVAGAAGNVVFERAIYRMRDETATGQRLQQAMDHTGLFPNMVIQMTAIGEESGSLDGMLGKVATFYEEEVDNAVDGLTSLMEPIIMAFLGVVIGGLVVAMYLPVFKMGSVL
ncbi:MAG: type II secretion system F family protein [Halofilum sp. (in: g-proteobacteria)]|nr:type II secretion system F family protein [Halofilum sp. (in: g-proteobacteria)]